MASANQLPPRQLLGKRPRDEPQASYPQKRPSRGSDIAPYAVGLETLTFKSHYLLSVLASGSWLIASLHRAPNLRSRPRQNSPLKNLAIRGLPPQKLSLRALRQLLASPTLLPIPSKSMPDRRLPQPWPARQDC